MWDQHKQTQFNDLQRRADLGQITPDEQASLDSLVQELEQDEWRRLHSMLDVHEMEHKAVQSEIEHIQSQNAQLLALEHRFTKLLERAQAELVDLTREREELRAEYEHILQ
jgi:hypothetical protein